MSRFEHEREVRFARLVREADLAWALAEATKPHLNTVERSHVYVAIGVGETFAAIKYLIALAAGKRIALPAELVQLCQRWLDVHIGQEDERYLRRHIEQVLIPYALRSKPEQDRTVSQQGAVRARIDASVA
jgi:hypothetical protein